MAEDEENIIVDVPPLREKVIGKIYSEAGIQALKRAATERACWAIIRLLKRKSIIEHTHPIPLRSYCQGCLLEKDMRAAIESEPLGKGDKIKKEEEDGKIKKMV